MNSDKSQQYAITIGLFCLSVTVIMLVSISAFNMFKIETDMNKRCTILSFWAGVTYGIACAIYLCLNKRFNLPGKS